MSKLMRPGDRNLLPALQAHDSPGDGVQTPWIKRTLSVLNAPFTILLLSVIGVNLLLAGYQERSFRRNELFKGRLERILDAQRQVVRVRADVEAAFRAARSEEDFTVSRTAEDSQELGDLADQLKRSPAISTLRRSQAELEALTESVPPDPSQAIGQATSAYKERLASYLQCIDTFTPEEPCADHHDDLVALIQRVANAYRDRADSFLQEPVAVPKPT